MARPARWIALMLAASSLGWPQARADDLLSYTVTLSKGRINPPTLEVPAGKRIKLVLRNEGPGPSEFENLDMHVEKILAPGAQSFVVLPSLRTGTYRFIDEFHPDAGGLNLIVK
ncbi:MAG: cupredoxin domain-containing protein [Burkholderiales bacterium]|nr:cupredoxin domain-containing protein [Burkholderiales bacterium]